ncbi:MAG: hypothetical protein QOE42_1872 [Chloroflexota bacterium]|jgi:hypothetical protein|nr:hypothetical protein [Chloroflexota bacterium]
MDQRESDPTGAFRGGSAGFEGDDTATEFERHAPSGAQPGGGRPNDGRPATDDKPADSRAAEADDTERDVITSGVAATSEVADPKAQANAEGQRGGAPRPR